MRGTDGALRASRPTIPVDFTSEMLAPRRVVLVLDWAIALSALLAIVSLSLSDLVATRDGFAESSISTG